MEKLQPGKSIGEKVFPHVTQGMKIVAQVSQVIGLTLSVCAFAGKLQPAIPIDPTTVSTGTVVQSQPAIFTGSKNDTGEVGPLGDGICIFISQTGEKVRKLCEAKPSIAGKPREVIIQYPSKIHTTIDSSNNPVNMISPVPPRRERCTKFTYFNQYNGSESHIEEKCEPMGK